MKIIIGQPKRSESLVELIDVLNRYQADLVLFPEGYIHGQVDLEAVAELAGLHQTAIVSSHLNDGDKINLASVVNGKGQIVFNRLKSTVEGPLLLPSTSTLKNTLTGYMLCREIFLDYDHLKDCEIIFNPIGVGMFSEEQFETWTSRAKAIAMDTKSYVIGASHADGSYRNCGFSIPIAYVYKPNGAALYLSKNDTRSVSIDLATEEIVFLE